MRKSTTSKIVFTIAPVVFTFFAQGCDRYSRSDLKSRLDCEKAMHSFMNKEGAPQSIAPQDNSTIKYLYYSEGYSMSFHWSETLDACLTKTEFGI